MSMQIQNETVDTCRTQTGWASLSNIAGQNISNSSNPSLTGLGLLSSLIMELPLQVLSMYPFTELKPCLKRSHLF